MSQTRKSTGFTMLAKTLFGLEETLENELRNLGAQDIKRFNRAVEFRGDTELLYRANLCLRTATRVLKPIRNFTAKDEKSLYRAIYNIDWTKYLSSESTLAIDSVVSGDIFTHSLFVSQKAKDSIVDQFRAKGQKRPNVDLERPDIRLNLYIAGDQARLALDSSGETLSRRGYRKESGMAPLNEVLAAGIILLSGWDISTPFIDPMCGAGTLPIEAAMIAAKILPGALGRKFAFQKWNDYDSALFERIINELNAQIDYSRIPKIVGSDNIKARISDSRYNAKRVNLYDYIQFEKKEFSEQPPPPPPGTMIINPPYGERLEIEDAQALHKSFGDVLKAKYDGYNAYILTGNLKAAKSIGLRTSRKIQLYNGSIECRLLKFEMYSGSRKTKAVES